jgi:uncharacterized membrane protein
VVKPVSANALISFLNCVMPASLSMKNQYLDCTV